jgi:hypothetical protein
MARQGKKENRKDTIPHSLFLPGNGNAGDGAGINK